MEWSAITRVGTIFRVQRYLRRHWAGDLPLAVSLGLNGAVPTIIAGLVLALGIRLESPGLGLFGLLAAFGIVWTGYLAMAAWQSVGVWRSAGRHVARGGRGFFAGIARGVAAFWAAHAVFAFLVIGIPLAQVITNIAFGDTAVPAPHIRTIQGNRVLELTGGITFGLPDAVKNILARDPEVRSVRLRSPGGRIGPAAELSAIIRQHGLLAYVPEECSSACTIVLMGARQRYVGPHARLGFHRPSLDGSENAYDNASRFSKQRQLFQKAGVADWFIDQVFATPSDEMWYPTVDELRRAGVITGVVSD